MTPSSAYSEEYQIEKLMRRRSGKKVKIEAKNTMRLIKILSFVVVRSTQGRIQAAQA